MRILPTIIVIAGVVLLLQTLTAGRSCADPSFRTADDVNFGYCYATLYRDSGNILSQYVDTINFDWMKLTGQHHEWARMPRFAAPTPAPMFRPPAPLPAPVPAPMFRPPAALLAPSPPPAWYRVWAKRRLAQGTVSYSLEPAYQLWAQHLTWNRCQALLAQAREGYVRWQYNGGRGWLGSASVLFGPPELEATCQPE